MRQVETIQAEVFNESDDSLLVDWLESTLVLHQWGTPSMNFPPTQVSLAKARNASNDQYIAYKGVAENCAIAYGEIRYIDTSNCSARLCRILIAPNHRGLGMGTTWIKALLEICFQELKLNRVGLNVYVENQGAIKCYQRAGFVIEGLLRETYKVDEGFWSEYRMSILHREWLQQDI